jgi:hypothetical protein
MKQPKLKNVKIDLTATETMRRLMAKAKTVKVTHNVDEDHAVLAEFGITAQSAAYAGLAGMTNGVLTKIFTSQKETALIYSIRAGTYVGSGGWI